MAKNSVGSIDIMEKDYVRKSVDDLRIFLAKRSLDTHFKNAPIDDGQLAILTVREVFKKGDKTHPLYFGTLGVVETKLTLPTGEEFVYSRPACSDIFLGNKLNAKKDKRAVFTVRRNGNKGLKGETSAMTAVAARQMDAAIFVATCDAVIGGLDFSQVKGDDDILLCGHVVARSQVFSNDNRKNLHIDFSTPFNGNEDDLRAALGLQTAQVFIAKKSVVVMWEV